MSSDKYTCDPDEKELEDAIRKSRDDAINKVFNSNNPLSILVAGASNSGKSSTISEVFGSDVGIGLDGSSTTHGIKMFMCKEKRLLLIDTPGLERKNNEDTIKQLGQYKPDILWLVLNYHAAIEDEELAIANLFPQVPTIVILNKVDTLQKHKPTDNDIKDFGSTEAIIPDILKGNVRLMNLRQRLIDWQSKTTANVKKILIMSLRKESPTDKPIGVVNLCEATWMNCDNVASVIFSQAQQVWKGDKFKGSIKIIIGSATVASCCGWIPIPGVDFLSIAGIQWSMLCGLCKLWGVSGENVKIFLNVMTRTVVPVIISYGLSSACTSVVKFFPGLGSIIGGSANSCIAGTFTLTLGALATFYLQGVHHGHLTRNEDELEKEINDSLNSDRFKVFLQKLKELVKDPKNINQNELMMLLEKS